MLIEIGTVVLEKNILKFRQCIFTKFHLGQGCGPSFEGTRIPFTQGSFVARLVETEPVVLEQKDFKISAMYFRYFVIIFSCKRAWPFI